MGERLALFSTEVTEGSWRMRMVEAGNLIRHGAVRG
jgi:hypothetical protein